METELKQVHKWVNGYFDRKIYFQDLKQLISYRNRVSNATNAKELSIILEELKSAYPKAFSEIPNETLFKILKQLLLATLNPLIFKICHKIVYGNKWIRVMAVVIRTSILILVVLIIYKLIFK